MSTPRMLAFVSPNAANTTYVTYIGPFTSDEEIAAYTALVEQDPERTWGTVLAMPLSPPLYAANYGAGGQDVRCPPCLADVLADPSNRELGVTRDDYAPIHPEEQQDGRLRCEGCAQAPVTVAAPARRRQYAPQPTIPVWTALGERYWRCPRCERAAFRHGRAGDPGTLWTCLPCGFRVQLAAPPAVGARVRLLQDVERFPHDIVRAGETGTVELVDGTLISVKLDQPHPNLAEWDNCLHWNEDNAYQFAEDTILIGGPNG